MEWIARMTTAQFTAVFYPQRTDDLKPCAKAWVGRMAQWRYLWTIEDGEYAGQGAYEPVNVSIEEWPGWVPECDLQKVTGDK